MSTGFDIVYQYQTDLEAHRLNLPFKGVSHEGWIVEPPKPIGSANALSLGRLSFFFEGRPVDEYEDPLASDRLFHVTLLGSKLLAGLDSRADTSNFSVAVAFCYDFTSNNNNAGRDSAELVVVSASQLENWNNRGLILGRLYFEVTNLGGVWHFLTDCVDFADKYYVDKGLTGFRVAPLPLRSGLRGFNPSVFVVRHFNKVVDSLPLILQRYPDGVLVPAELDCRGGVDLSSVLVDPSDPVGAAHPREGLFYAIGYKSSVQDGADNSGGSYKVGLSVLGYGGTLDEAVERSVDADTGLLCPPVAVVEWSSYQSVITQFEFAPAISPTTNRHIVIDTESPIEEPVDGVVLGLDKALCLPVPVHLSSSGGLVSAGIHSLSGVMNDVVRSLAALSGVSGSVEEVVLNHRFPYMHMQDPMVVHLNDYHDPGIYVFSHPMEDSSGFPVGWGFGVDHGVILEVIPFYSGSAVRQVICSQESHLSFERFSFLYSDPLDPDFSEPLEMWTAWSNLSGNGLFINYWGKTLPEGASWNLDEYFSLGVYVLHPVENATPTNNWPSNWSTSEEEEGVGILEVFPFGSEAGSSVRQILYSKNSGSIWSRNLFGDRSFSMWCLLMGEVVAPGFVLVEDVTSVPVVGQQLRYVLKQGSLLFGEEGHSYRGTVGGIPVDFSGSLSVSATYVPEVEISYSLGMSCGKEHGFSAHTHPAYWNPVVVQLLRYM